MLRDFLRQVLSSGRKPGFPLIRYEYRLIPDDFRGIIVTSDIDKTYLDTQFASFRDLLRTALESAAEKRSLLGMAPLLRGFQSEEDVENPSALYFISASPPMMRDTLLEKMTLDGIKPDGLTLKDPIRLVRRGRWRHLRHHILYKLTALLLNRYARPPSAQVTELLVGDDSETDAQTYLFYHRILNATISPQERDELFTSLEATSSEITFLHALLEHQDQSRVGRIYIHRTMKTPLDAFPPHQREELLPADDSLQIAADAFLAGWLSPAALAKVAQDFSPQQQQTSASQALARAVFSPSQIEAIDAALQPFGLRYHPPDAP